MSPCIGASCAEDTDTDVKTFKFNLVLTLLDFPDFEEF